MIINWLGHEDGAHEHEAMMREYITRFGSLDAKPDLRGRDDDDDMPNPVAVTVHDNIAVLDVTGGLITSTSFFSRYFGVASYEDIKDRLVELSEDRNIKGVLMNYNTNGGNAEGCGMLATFIRTYSDSVKPVFSYSATKAFSAGFWLFSAGAQNYMDPDAQLGSVGCISVHFEMTEMHKKIGIKATVFRSAPNKALGSPYEKLTDKATAALQKMTNFWHTRFVNGLAALTGLDVSRVEKQLATGDTFDSDESTKLEIVDGVVSFESTLLKLQRAVGRTKPDPASTTKILRGTT